jgi:hypothetical protein
MHAVMLLLLMKPVAPLLVDGFTIPAAINVFCSIMMDAKNMDMAPKTTALPVADARIDDYSLFAVIL